MVFSVFMMIPVMAAMAQMFMFLFAAEVGLFDKLGHVVGSNANQSVIPEVFQRFFEQYMAVAAVIACNRGILQQLVGFAAYPLEHDAVHFVRFEILDDFVAIMGYIVPKSGISVFVDQGKPFGCAKQRGNGALCTIGFNGYRSH